MNATEQTCDRCSAPAVCQPVQVEDEDGRRVVEQWCRRCAMIRARTGTAVPSEKDGGSRN